MDNIEATVVSLTVSDDTDSAHVAPTGDHGNHTRVESDRVGDLARGEIDLDGVVDLDGRVGVSDTRNTISIPFCVFPTTPWPNG